jgi:hypothetical protein
MNKKLELKNFELKKVKFNAKKGLEIDWFDLNQRNDLYSVDSDSKPSDDYVTALNPLKEVFAYALGLNDGWDFSREHNRKNDELLKKTIQFWNDENERINVSGLVVVGAGETKGIKITGSLQTELGTIGLSSPTIRFDSEITNSVDELIMIGDLAESAFKEIEKEVWSFIYQSKRGGELFGSESVEGGLNGVVTMQKVG